MTPPWNDTLSALQARLLPLGFDCLGALNLRWLSKQELGPWLKQPEAAEGSLAIVIANTRALWPPFMRALRQDPPRLSQPHPLDSWVQEQLSASIAEVASLRHLAFAHTTGPEVVPIQRLAERAGLGALSPGHLLIHPTYGPWISLRAVAIFEVPGPEGAPPAPKLTCDACPSGCAPAFEAALAGAKAPRPGEHEAQWRRWLAIRDACPIGREHRFPEHAIHYHYSKDKAALRVALERS